MPGKSVGDKEPEEGLGAGGNGCGPGVSSSAGGRSRQAPAASLAAAERAKIRNLTRWRGEKQPPQKTVGGPRASAPNCGRRGYTTRRATQLMTEPTTSLDYPEPNDIPGALAFIRARGETTREDLHVLAMLQDDPEELLTVIARLKAEGTLFRKRK